MFTRDLVENLNALPSRPWRELSKGKPIDEYWLSAQLRPFGIRLGTVRVGEQTAKGYAREDLLEPARRYVSKADWEAYKEAFLPSEPPRRTGRPANHRPERDG